MFLLVGDIELIVQIDEKNFGLFKFGQKVMVLVDVYFDQCFVGEINFISLLVDLLWGFVEICLYVLELLVYLCQEMMVLIDIEIVCYFNVLVILVDVVCDGGSVQFWVLVVCDGIVCCQDVEFGVCSDGKVEIWCGIVVGEQIIFGSQLGFCDGSCVCVVIG